MSRKPNDERPLSVVLREVDERTKALFIAASGGEPAPGYPIGTCARLARELRALAPLLRHLATEEEPSTEALDRAAFLADELEAK